jgi:hypothetical protein
MPAGFVKRMSGISAAIGSVEPVLVLISAACAVRGQWLLIKSEPDSTSGLPWLFAAMVIFAALVLWRDRSTPLLDVRRSVVIGHRWYFLVASVILSLAALYLIVSHEQAGALRYWDTPVLWIASCMAYLMIFRWPGWAWLRQRLVAHQREILLVAGLTLLAAVLRFVWLDRVPDIMNGDEGLHGMFARQVVEGANIHPFSTFYGYGALYLFVVAFAIKLLGYTNVATRIVPAIGGLLGVPAIYLLARRLFGLRVAFVAAGLVAVLHSHLQFSRVLGVGYINATLFASLGVYLLYSALETGSQLRAALGGVVLGIWLYVYVDSRFVPAVLAAWLLILIILPGQRAFVLGALKPLAAFGGGYLIAAAPMGLWAWRHWNDFMARFSSDGTLWNGYYVRVLAQNDNLHLPQFLLDQLNHAFFSITRYRVYDFYQSPAPLLDVLTAALFWLAVIYSLLHLLDRRHLLLNIWLWSGIASIGLLMIPRSSDGYRLLIVLIPIAIMVGVVAEQLALRWSSAFRRPSWATGSALAALFVALLVINADVYFRQYASSCEYGGDSETRIAYSLGTVLARMQRGEHAIVLGNDNIQYGTHASAQYLNPGVIVQNLTQALPPDIGASSPPQAFILIPERLNDLAYLQKVFPGGQVKQVTDCTRVVLYVYTLH